MKTELEELRETRKILLSSLRRANTALQLELARASERGLEFRWEPLREIVQQTSEVLRRFHD